MRRLALLPFLAALHCANVQDTPPGDPSPVAPAASSTPSPVPTTPGSPGSSSPKPTVLGVDPNPTALTESTLSLAIPRAGDRPWARGSVHAVSWAGAGDSLQSKAAVSMSTDAGVTWLYVPAVDIDTETQSAWVTVPDEGGTELRLRVRVGQKVSEAVVGIDENPLRKSYTFQRVSSNLPMGARDGMVGVVFRGKMYGLGGWNPQNPVAFPEVVANDVWTSVDGATWAQLRPNTFLDANTFDSAAHWTGRHFFGATVFNDEIFIVGGDPIHTVVRDAWKSSDGVTWQKLTNSSQYPLRVFQHTVSFGGLWVLGGEDGEVAFNDVWRSQDGINWNQVPTQGPMWAPRGLIGGEAVWGNRMWVIGGGTYYPDRSGPPRDYGDVWSTVDGSVWRRDLEMLPFATRHYHNVASYDGRIWVLGGYNNTVGNVGDVFYSTDGYNWFRQPTPAELLPRHGATAWAHDGALYWGSGNCFSDDGTWQADMWKLTPTPAPTVPTTP